MPRPFAHLHVHTQYSLLDGAARLPDLFAACQEMGMTHLAMTDHGNLHGAHEFHRLALAAGITPIIGIEAYVAPGSRRDRQRVLWGRPDQRRDDVSGAGAYTHKTIWARDLAGLHHLFRLSSDAYQEGWLTRWPRTDKETLAALSGGLLASTGCPSGEVQTRLRLGRPDLALRAAAEYQDIFGRENYFLELMDHGLEIERRVRDGLLEIGRALRIPPLVTNDSHYTWAREAEAHDVLLCIRTGRDLADPDRLRFEGTGYHLRSPEQMYALDTSEAWQLGCANTVALAERIDTTGWFAPQDLMPRFAVPEGWSEAGWFRAEVARGMAGRYPGGVPEDRRRQAEYEADVIVRSGFAGYFLVVADLVGWARRQGIAVGPGRGSAAASIAAYALGVTDLDPLEHGLVFERFLNPERVSPPDVDLDFDERRRAEVIRYATDTYGADKVALIGTFGTIKARNAIRDSARVLGHPYALGDRIAKALPADVLGRGVPLRAVLDPAHPRHGETAEVRAMYEHEPEVARVIDTARGVEGLVRQTGVHAAGVIMSGEPLTDHVPVRVRHPDGAVITQWDYPGCEALGLLKMDLLGLRNLTIMDDAVRLVKAGKGVDIDLSALPLDDAATFELLGRGDTLGVFQFDGGPMRALLRMVRPDRFEDICAVSALYRPGPMGMDSHLDYALRKNGRQEITPIHPQLARPLQEVLGVTYGLVVYQEQVQKAAQIVAGYSLGQADLLRRAMGKKQQDELDREFVPFRRGARERGYGDEAVQALWDVLVPFAGYAFNKAHACAYGLVSYRNAYLKANHPAEYMAALLTSVRDSREKSAAYLNECRRIGITVLPPDVNESEAGFTARSDSVILFGLSAVRNVGPAAVDSILRCRRSKGRYASFPDFLDKVEAVVCTKRTVESLIKAGAFDQLNHTRKGLAERYEAMVDTVAQVKRREAEGQFDLFGGPAGPAGGGAGGSGPRGGFGDAEWDRPYLLAQEREMLGLYVSDHPLFGADHLLAERTDGTVAALTGPDGPDGAVVTIGGIVSGLRHRTTRQGDPWAVATVEDLSGSVECVFLPATYRALAAALVEDTVVLVSGRLDRREDAPRLVASELTVPDLPSAAAQPVVIRIPRDRLTPPLVARLGALLAGHRGTTEVHVRLVGGAGPGTLLRLDHRHRVAPAPAFFADVERLLPRADAAGRNTPHA